MAIFSHMYFWYYKKKRREKTYHPVILRLDPQIMISLLISIINSSICDKPISWKYFFNTTQEKLRKGYYPDLLLWDPPTFFTFII